MIRPPSVISRAISLASSAEINITSSSLFTSIGISTNGASVAVASTCDQIKMEAPAATTTRARLATTR